MLRVAEGEKGEALCIRCHSDMQHIEWTGHATIVSDRAGDDSNSCMPCHSVHAHPQQIDQDLLWPLELLRYAEPLSADATADRYCVGCHRTDGPAAAPLVASHPPMAMASNPLAEAFGTLPLYDESGQLSTTGRITCRTCHLPHGREIESDRLADASLTPAQRRARRAQLRPFQAPNLCSGCHGFDALQRFLYFHDPERRGGQAAGFSPPSIWQPR